MRFRRCARRSRGPTPVADASEEIQGIAPTRKAEAGSVAMIAKFRHLNLHVAPIMAGLPTLRE